MDNILVEKYQNLGFLDGVEEENQKFELSKLFENSLKYLLSKQEFKNVNTTEEDIIALIQKNNSLEFVAIYIPVIRYLFTKYGNTNYISLYDNLKWWMEKEGNNWKKDIDTMQQYDLICLYLRYYYGTFVKNRDFEIWY